MVQFKLFRQLI